MSEIALHEPGKSARVHSTPQLTRIRTSAFVTRRQAPSRKMKNRAAVTAIRTAVTTSRRDTVTATTPPSAALSACGTGVRWEDWDEVSAMGDHWCLLALVGALVVFNAVLAGSEIALISLRAGQLRQLERVAGLPRARWCGWPGTPTGSWPRSRSGSPRRVPGLGDRRGVVGRATRPAVRVPRRRRRTVAIALIGCHAATWKVVAVVPRRSRTCASARLLDSSSR
jgi:hypothetical protein